MSILESNFENIKITPDWKLAKSITKKEQIRLFQLFQNCAIDLKNKNYTKGLRHIFDNHVNSTDPLKSKFVDPKKALPLLCFCNECMLEHIAYPKKNSRKCMKSVELFEQHIFKNGLNGSEEKVEEVGYVGSYMFNHVIGLDSEGNEHKCLRVPMDKNCQVITVFTTKNHPEATFKDALEEKGYKVKLEFIGPLLANEIDEYLLKEYKPEIAPSGQLNFLDMILARRITPIDFDIEKVDTYAEFAALNISALTDPESFQSLN